MPGHTHGTEWATVTHAAHATDHHFMWVVFSCGCIVSVATKLCADLQSYVVAAMANAGRVQPETER